MEMGVPDGETDIGEGVYLLVHDGVVPFRLEKDGEHRACDASAGDDNSGLRHVRLISARVS